LITHGQRKTVHFSLYNPPKKVLLRNLSLIYSSRVDRASDAFDLRVLDALCTCGPLVVVTTDRRLTLALIQRKLAHVPCTTPSIALFPSVFQSEFCSIRPLTRPSLLPNSFSPSLSLSLFVRTLPPPPTHLAITNCVTLSLFVRSEATFFLASLSLSSSRQSPSDPLLSPTVTVFCPSCLFLVIHLSLSLSLLPVALSP
jgi:hypothetical protein